jgi:hypothetical protein
MIYATVAVVLLVAFFWHLKQTASKAGSHRKDQRVHLPNWVYMLWFFTIAVFTFFAVIQLGTE